MSYRRAWDLLESLNASFRERVVATTTGGRGGGGASLTPFGSTLVRSYRRFESAIQARANRHFSGLTHNAREAPAYRAVSSAPVVRLNARAGRRALSPASVSKPRK
jgi:molybdate transport repressor ModE-like protein